ncbi:MAG: DedA family protein [Bacteroidaceae bacterium]|jgi:membrane protein YqaA with SNARE-associated domain|nr:DedA family protein [Bacteroidaceae bacterium]
MVESLIDFFKDYGYWGMGVLSFLSGSIVPIASEVLLLFFLGLGLSAVWLTVVATVGNTMGGITCFMLGYLTDKETVQRIFRIPDKRMKRANMLIQKYGYWTAMFSFVPAIGEVVLLVLGIMRVNKYKVIAVMAFGKFARYAFIAASFYGFSNLLK